MPDFHLTNARILADGRTVRLQFEAGVSVGQPALDRLKDVGFMDYRPAQEAGKVVTVNGQAAKMIGLQCEDWNMPLPWIDPPQSGGSIKAGEYFFLVAIYDANGRETHVGPPVFGNSDNSGERGHMLAEGSKVTLNWRVAPPTGGHAAIYVATAKPIIGNLRSVGESNGTSCTLTNLTPKDNAWVWQRQSVCLTVTCLLDREIVHGLATTVTVPDGLVSDEKGNSTTAAGVTAENWSCLNILGTLNTQRGTPVCISSSQGDDNTADGTEAKPYKAIGKALKTGAKWYSFKRGDTFPFEPWLVQTPGASLDDAVCYDAYGEGAKPILLGDTSTAPDPNGERVWFRQYDPKTGRVGDAPHQYFEGLRFVGDPTRGALPPIWPAGSPQDHIVLIDCEFDNVQLQPSYGSAQKRAPIGNALIRCTVSNVHANVSSPAHVQGMFIAHCGDFLISECDFDRNGWRYDGDTQTPASNDIFCHNVYCASMARQVIAVSSVMKDGGHSGLQMRGGGVCYDSHFTGNVSGFSAMDTHSLIECAFEVNGLYNHIVSQSPSWAPQAIHDGNVVRDQKGFDQTRTVVANYDGLNCFHHDSQGQYVPHMIVVRSETSRNGGAISMGNQLPTGHLIVTDNRIDNVAKDYKGNPLRNVVTKANVNGWNSPAITWDRNTYTHTGARDAYVVGDRSTDSFAQWQRTGSDEHGQELQPGQPDPVPVPPTPPTPPAPEPRPPIALEPLVVFCDELIAAATKLKTALGAK